MTEKKAEAKTYQGSCHCGDVKYEVTTDLTGLISCNCSICGRSGTVLGFVPAGQFKQLAGEDALTDYTFKSGTIHHLFCKKCGVRSFARGTMPDGTPMVAINARCLEGVDVATLDIKAVDGKSF